MNDLDFGVSCNNQFTIANALEDDNFFGLTSNNINANELSNNDNNNLTEETIINPFYVGTQNNTLMDTKDAELFTNFKRCLALCIKNECNIPLNELDCIYQKYITQDNFKELANFFVLIPVSIKLMKNNLHRRTSIILERPNLTLFNSLNVTLENSEIIVPLLGLNIDKVKLYNNMYESNNDINMLITTNVLYNYFEEEKGLYRNVVMDRLCQMLNDLKDSNYWTNPYFCNINITEAFQNRTFKLKESIDDNLRALITGKNTGVTNQTIQNIFNKKKTSYDLQNIYRKDTYTDVSNAIKNKKYTLYRIDNNPLDITKEQVNELFKSTTDDKLIFHTFNTLLLSKKHCHLVLNNKFVLTKMEKFFNSKFIVLYNYIFSYPWLCLYLEECIVKTRTVRTNRYVFDIDTANKLPFFPYNHTNIHSNPYCTLNIKEKVINAESNYLGLPMIANYKGYGIATLNGFRTKFNIFTTGQPDKNIFDGLETIPNTNVWKNFAVSGSVIPACTPKRNPLVDQVADKNMSEVDKIRRFFNEYYNESDIDLMCNSKSVFDFMDNINNLVSLVKNNLCDLIGKDVSDSVEVEPIKTLCIIVNVKYIEEEMKDMGETDHVIQNINSPEIKERFYGEYFNCKMEKNKQNRLIKKGNPLYEHFYKITNTDDMNIIVTTYEITKKMQYETDSDTYVYLNDLLSESAKVPEDKNILVLKISESIKFKIKSQYMNHNIEAFRTRYDDYFSCVAKFHLACVRGYYNGDNLYMLVSCVTALLTYLDLEYKYFAGKGDPIDIINKYRMRGFGTIVNEQEKQLITQYNSSVDKWKDVFNVDPKNKQTVKNQFGYKKFNDPLYKPGKFNRGYTDDQYVNLNPKYILTDEDYYNYFKINYAYEPGIIDFLKLKGIREDGNVEPLKKWILEAAYDELQ